ncbi:MinD/ParA family ATP-binding protein, partial [Miniimonas arenae]|uniref:MinD/ParA family ATP-binding protein n=1 Tax=Miniimonas arenae TaxID=676201 RepID=UPI003CCC512D
LSAPVEEVRELEHRSIVGSQWSRPRTILIGQPKGGVGKTPMVALLAGTFGEVRGGGVLAWDNNETLGTLGIRTAEGRFPTTVLDLLGQLDHFESNGGRRGDLNAFVRPQPDGHFDVLASDEDPARMAQVGEAEFERIHDVVTRFYPLVLIDSGNNPRAANFLAATHHADLLVIPVQWAQDSVESAGRLIDQLRRSGYGDLVQRAVVVATNDGRGRAPTDKCAEWREWFTRTCAAVVDVPFDPHIAERGELHYSQLSTATKRAFLAVAAAITSHLDTYDAWEGSR